VGGIACNVTFAAVNVRAARHDDLEAAACTIAAVAEEDFLGAQPPVDVDDRVGRFRELIERGDPAALWVLEDDDGQVVGHAAVQESVAGVLSLGMAILAPARPGWGTRPAGRGEGARSVVRRPQDLARGVDDNARAIALYAAAGFEVEGLRRDHYRRRDGRLRSTLIMAWRADNA
jgi:RimJ/RimL family protein N-acetyltransferase